MAALRQEDIFPVQARQATQISRRVLLTLERMSMEPCVFEALNKIREQILSGGISILTQSGHKPRHPATRELRAHLSKLTSQIVLSMYKQGLCLLARRKHGTLGEVFECMDACDFDISFTELRHRRKYSCFHRRSWGKARRDVVVVEFPPYRPNHTGLPCSPMCSLLETYLIRRQLENTRLAFSLDHAADGVLLARKRTGNVDRIFEEAYLKGSLPNGLGSKPQPPEPRISVPPAQWKDRDNVPEAPTGDRGFLPGLVFRAGKQDAGQLAELALLEELQSDKFYELALQPGRTTAVAGVCAARDNTALVYSREALRPEQEISHEQWCALVARAFSLPIGQTDRRNRSAEVIHAFQFYRNSFLHQTALFRDFLNDLLADLETANLRARASHWGLRTDVDKQLLKCWWKAEVLGAPDTGSVEELLQLIKLQNTLRPDLTHEAAILRALYENYMPSTVVGSSKRAGHDRARRGRP